MSFPNASPRRLAYDILQRVDEGAYADLVLNAALNRSLLDGRDKALVTELVYGVLRLRGRLDFALTQFCDRPLNRVQAGVLRLLRLGAYQLLELDRIPPHAAVHATVELAREVELEKATGLINGVLRALERGRGEIIWPPPEEIKAYLQQVCSLPTWLAKELLRQLPNSESRAFAEALALPAPQSLRANRLKIDRDSLLAKLEGAGHQVRPCRFAPDGIIVEQRGEGSLPGDAEGWYQVQDEASQLIPQLLAPQAGERLLDACAAPGGKTTQLAALTGNRAEILALDKHPQRVELVRQGAQRLGCTQVEARQWDLTEAPAFLPPESFDGILVDAPCSGLGVLRRNPESRWSRSPAQVRELALLQQQILANVAPLVRPGGRLVYSVCTFTTAETDAVVEHFLATQPQFAKVDLRQQAPAGWDELFTSTGALRSYPHHHDGMDAFFAVCLRRRD